MFEETPIYNSRVISFNFLELSCQVHIHLRSRLNRYCVYFSPEVSMKFRKRKKGKRAYRDAYLQPSICIDRAIGQGLGRAPFAKWETTEEGVLVTSNIRREVFIP